VGEGWATAKEDHPMWAQMLTLRLKPGKEEELPRVYELLRAAETPGSGLLRSTAMRDDKDPNRIVNVVIFESEEKAREREQDPARREALAEVQKLMADLFDGPPEFVDLTVLEDAVY
jgi:quinol monooxygenase YgiN